MTVKGGYAGEVANVIVDPEAKQYPVYAHLNRGGVESVASGTAIGLKGKELIGEEADSSRKVFALAAEGNEIALGIIDKMSTYDEYLANDENARKRTVFTANKEDDED